MGDVEGQIGPISQYVRTYFLLLRFILFEHHSKAFTFQLPFSHASLEYFYLKMNKKIQGGKAQKIWQPLAHMRNQSQILGFSKYCYKLQIITRTAD